MAMRTVLADITTNMDSMLFNDGISHVIQLAVAPVFLLASISGALNVLSQRMGRIIDRGRRLNEISVDANLDTAAEIDREYQSLAERARLTHRAIALCTLSALLVCLVIVFLFVDVIFELNLDWFIAFVFVTALLALIMALVTFLREIGLGTYVFRFGHRSVTKKGTKSS
jgi:hypothetical protein